MKKNYSQKQNKAFSTLRNSLLVIFLCEALQAQPVAPVFEELTICDGHVTLTLPNVIEAWQSDSTTRQIHGEKVGANRTTIVVTEIEALLSCGQTCTLVAVHSNEPSAEENKEQMFRDALPPNTIVRTRKYNGREWQAASYAAKVEQLVQRSNNTFSIETVPRGDGGGIRYALDYYWESGDGKLTIAASFERTTRQISVQNQNNIRTLLESVVDSEAESSGDDDGTPPIPPAPPLEESKELSE